jgi:protein TonB
VNAVRSVIRASGWGEAARWSACFALALAFHAGGAAALLARWQHEPDAVASAPLILVELAPVAVAPQAMPIEVAPGPQQNQTERRQIETLPVEDKAEPVPEAKLAILPPLKPPEPPKEKKPQQAARLTTAPSPAERRAERAAAPAPGANSRNAFALPNWKSQLVAQLERNKRYPAEAQARGDSGVALLSFSIDRNGGVHRARITRSSGSALLDRETLALVERARPLPPPPAEVPGASIPVTVPIRYNIR